MEHNCEAFSLCNEIGTCPQEELHLKLTNKVPFPFHQYTIKVEKKQIIEKEMNYLEN